MAKYTLEQLQALRQAIAEGVTYVAANGRQVTYRSLKEMQQLEREMASELEPDNPRPSRIYASFKRA